MKNIHKTIFYILIGLLTLALSACNFPGLNGSAQGETAAPGGLPGEADPPQSVQEASLDGSQWQLESYGAPGAETPVIAGTDVTLLLDAGGDASGTAGCNSFGGQYYAADGQITFSQLISTAMACVDTSVMAQEQAYLQALQAAGTYTLTEGQLTVTSQDGTAVLHFVPLAPSPEPTVASTLMCEPTETTTTDGWTLCRSLLYGFDLAYPAEGELIEQQADYARINLPFTPGTNLTEKYLEIAFTDTIGECTSPLAAGRPASSVMQEMVTANSNTFFKQTGDGIAAGNIYTWEAYSIAQANRCISLDFVLHSHHPELDPTPPPAYDQAAESAIFAQIVETFSWLGSAQYTDSSVDPTATPDMSSQPAPPPTRINFVPGAVSGQESGQLAASGMDAYVLRALEGQTMQVDLSFTQGLAILIIWGEDGTVLISDHAGASTFTGMLPSTQDYYIHVRGAPDSTTSYLMTVTIE